MHNVTPDVIDLSICKTNLQYTYPKVQRLVAFVLNVECSFELYSCTVSRIQGTVRETFNVYLVVIMLELKKKA